MWLQYTHLDKLYGYLPGITDALPSLFGLERAEDAELTAGFDAQAQQAAQQLLDEDSFASQVDALPFRPGQMVLAVGDSMTDDLQSWAEILRHLLDLRRGHGTRVVNGGLSAHTTAMVLHRWAVRRSRRWPRRRIGSSWRFPTAKSTVRAVLGTSGTVAGLLPLPTIRSVRSRSCIRATGARTDATHLRHRRPTRPAGGDHERSAAQRPGPGCCVTPAQTRHGCHG